jgi:hypothetical protein
MTDLPLHLTPMVRDWACRKRGLCCTKHQVLVAPDERVGIQRALEERGDPLALTLTADGDSHTVLPMKDEVCVFLGEDRLCTLRKRFGEAVYPAVCKKFPFLAIRTPDRQILGLTFSCPTALELLAQEPAFKPRVETGTPPVDRGASLHLEDRRYIDFRGDSTGLEAFWKAHWDFLDRLARHPEPQPARRLAALAEALTGIEAPPPAVVRRDLWRQGAFEPAVERELRRLTGEVPPGLPWLWVDIQPQSFTLDPLPDLDEDALLMRYLLHRTFLPIAYTYRADGSFLLATLFAMIARYRIERARGHAPLVAIRNLDRYFIHTGNSGAIFGTEADHPAWQAMSALAMAVAVG